MNETIVSRKRVAYVLYLFFYLIFIQEDVSFAQQPTYTNEQKFGVDDGLPQSFITGFAQDKDGFIWVSTLDGLSRFDGRVFKNFRNKPADSTTIAQNVILKILPQADSTKLTLVYEGLRYDRFDTRTFKSKRIRHLSTLHNIRNSKVQFLLNRANVYDGTDWLFPVSGAAGIGWRNTDTGKTFFANTTNGLLKQDTTQRYFSSRRW